MASFLFKFLSFPFRVLIRSSSSTLTKVSLFVENNHQITEGLGQVERVCAKYGLIIAKTFEDYCDERRSKGRKWKAFIMRTVQVIYFIKNLLVAIFPSNKFIRNFCSDGNYILGPVRVVSLSSAFGPGFNLMISLFMHFKELTQSDGKYLIFKLLNDIKLRRPEQRLRHKHSVRYGLYLNLMARYLSEPTIKFLYILTTLAVVQAQIYGYYDQNNDVPLLALIFWSFVNELTFYCSWSTNICISLLSVSVILQIKYQFKEINEQIIDYQKSENPRLLMDALLRHNELTVKTHRLNQFFKYVIAIFYFMVTPVMDFLIHSGQDHQTSIVYRVASGIFFLTLIIVMLSINVLSVSVTKTAHNSEKLLNKIMFRNKLSQKLKLKVISTIERLSETHIGFYCLDLFPMNYYNFYEYCVQIFLFYFLFCSLI